MNVGVFLSWCLLQVMCFFQMVPPVDTPVGRLGLSICYDLRFAELALWNRNKGAQILSYPSAFTLNTGLAHWEVGIFSYAVLIDSKN